LPKHLYRFVSMVIPTLARLLPQRHIAAYLGITPESLSRIRAERGRGELAGS
jgi:CRP-like cAMP-binding protein